MISELWLLPPLLSLLGLAVHLRLSGRRSWGRALQAALLVSGLAILAWPALIGGSEKTLPLVVVIDGSLSMGPKLDDFVDLAALSGEGDRELLVVLAGARALSLYSGPAAELPGHLAAPRELGEALFRSRADLGPALDLAEARLAGRAYDLLLVGDGGFRAPRAAAAHLHQALFQAGPRDRAENLSLSFTSPPPLLRADGEPVMVDLRLTGRLHRARSLRVAIAGQAGLDLDLQAGDVAEDLRFAVAARGSEDRLLARIEPPWRDADPSDDQDELPLQAEAGGTLPLLFVHGDGAAPALRRLLAEDPAFEILPRGSSLKSARLCVIDSVPAESLPFSDAELEAFVMTGGGLFLAGSSRAFGAGGWEGRAIDELSPLRARPGRKPRLLRFALDRSGSMATADRLAAAASSLRALFASLGPEDTLELILFAGSREHRFYARADADAAARLAEDLLSLGASGGTDLRGLLEELAIEPAAAEREVLVVIATDGRDPRGLDSGFTRGIAERLRASEQTLQLLWFDRDPALRPALELLVGDLRRLHEVDDLGRLVEPFFAALGDELARDDVELRRADGSTVAIARLLRTRRAPEASILMAGGPDENGLARVRRGLGQVAAAPVEVAPALAQGLFDGDGLVGFAALRALLVDLADRPAAMALERLAEAEGEVLELRAASLPEAGMALFDGRRKLPLRRVAPDRARTAPTTSAARSGSYHLVDAAGRRLGALLLGPPARRDLGPEPDPARGRALAANLGGGAGARRELPSLLPLGLLLLFAIEVMLRSRDR